MANLFLSAKRVSPNPNRDLTPNPKIALLQTEQIVKVKPFKKGISLIYGTSQRPWKRYRMAETPDQYEAAQRLANGLTTAQNTNVAASGTTQGTAQAITTTYHNAVTAATAASQCGVLLPLAANSFNNGGAVVVRNDTNVTLSVYPGTAEIIDNQSANAPVTVGGMSRIHFVPSASNKWLSARYGV